VIETELARYMEPGRLQGLIDQISTQLAAEGKGPFKWENRPARSRNLRMDRGRCSADEIGGRYCENCHAGKIVPRFGHDYRRQRRGARGMRSIAANAEALWKKSEEMVGENF